MTVPLSATRQGLAARLAGRLGAFDLDVTFEAPARGVTALFGPSGCGKTTVLRSVAGLLHLPGAVTLGGDTWQDTSQQLFVPPHRRGVGYVFQEASLFPHLSVRDNMLYGACRGGVTPATAGTALADMLDVLGMSHLVDRSPATLSGGERQRVALGRALLSRPRLLLMDEPLSALDRITKESILPYVERIVATADLPILYVSHDVTEVARLAQQVVVMQAGRVVRAGATADVLDGGDLQADRPAGETCAVLDVHITGQHADGVTELGFSGGALLVPRIEGVVGARVRLRVVAEGVLLAREEPTAISALNVLTVVIEKIAADHGRGAVVRVRCGADHLLARVPGRSVSALALEPGQSCFAILNPAAFAIDPSPGAVSVRERAESKGQGPNGPGRAEGDV